LHFFYGEPVGVFEEVLLVGGLEPLKGVAGLEVGLQPLPPLQGILIGLGDGHQLLHLL